MKKKCLRIVLIVTLLVVIFGGVIVSLILHDKKKAVNVFDVEELTKTSISELEVPTKEFKEATTSEQMEEVYYEYMELVESNVAAEGYLIALQEWFGELNLKKKVDREDVLKDLSDSDSIKGYWIEPYIYCECNGKTYLYKVDNSLENEVWYEVSNPSDPLDAIDYEPCENEGMLNAKPVIYLYPENEMKVDVTLDVAGVFTYTYPKYQDGWSVIASPDGTLKDVKTGEEYSYLFWESTTKAEYDMSEGFVVKGSDATEFLKEKLSYMGLTPREYNEFIVYWAPILEQNEYNLIKFAKEEYENDAKLTISPQPDSILRVFMVYKALEGPVEIKEQELETFERKGFTVVEWGGRIYE